MRNVAHRKKGGVFVIDESLFDVKSSKQGSPYKIGTVTDVQAAGVKVKFDGEENASDKYYPILLPYAPQVGDRVLSLKLSGSIIILGSIGRPTI